MKKLMTQNIGRGISCEFFVLTFVCTTIPFLNGCGNNDGTIVKKDLREITEYIESAEQKMEKYSKPNSFTYNRDVAALEKNRENMKEYINMKRVENFEIWKRAAEKGIPEGQMLLGICYLEGIGVHKDEAVGASWVRKAAEKGHVAAQMSLSKLYFEGIGVPESATEAAKWICKAAEQGHIEAQILFAGFYSAGIGVPESEVEAAKWIRKVAEKGHAEAQYNLGNRYYFGQGVSEDKKEAIQWYLKAARQGHADAMWRLGVCYFNGIDVSENKEEAEKWLIASEQKGKWRANWGAATEIILDEDGEVKDIRYADIEKLTDMKALAFIERNATDQFSRDRVKNRRLELEKQEWLTRRGDQFIPDYEITTTHAYYKGVLMFKNDEAIRIETAPSVIQVIPMRDIKKHGPLRKGE